MEISDSDIKSALSILIIISEQVIPAKAVIQQSTDSGYGGFPLLREGQA
jgi:hypothetical protein